jgi:glutamyl-tRNA reductase
MRVGVIGLNHKQADIGLRERLAQACERCFGSGEATAGAGLSFILLSTCNRTEIYYYSTDLAEAHTWILALLRGELTMGLEQRLYSYFGLNCFLHLARVTAGLDSAVVGETEIQGQVKVAYEAARRRASLPNDLHRLFQKSLQIGKRVRTQVRLDQQSPTLEEIVVRAAEQATEDFYSCRLLFVGASEVNLRVLERVLALGAKNVTLCNRTAEKGSSLAAQWGIQPLAWSRLDRWLEYDVAIFATKSPVPLIWAHEWRPRWPLPLLIDLSVPRNVDPALAHFARIINIDALDAQVAQARFIRREAVAHAAALVAHGVSQHLQIFDCRRQIPQVA